MKLKTAQWWICFLQTHRFSPPKMLTDGLWITYGLLRCFYQLFGLSFWRHPFTTEDPLVSNWCNAQFLQICSDEETCTSWIFFITRLPSLFFFFFFFLLSHPQFRGKKIIYGVFVCKYDLVYKVCHWCKRPLRWSLFLMSYWLKRGHYFSLLISTCLNYNVLPSQLY